MLLKTLFPDSEVTGLVNLISTAEMTSFPSTQLGSQSLAVEVPAPVASVGVQLDQVISFKIWPASAQ